MDIKEFQTKVLNRSKEVPVIVDFWAPWCGPCQMLGPVMEELASEAKGKWELVKVNTDESQEVSAKYGIRGIPDVKMFLNGEVVADFTGALPKYQIQNWLEEHIPDERVKELEIIVEKKDIVLLAEFVDKNPDFEQAKLKLAEGLLLSDIEKAKSLINEIKPTAKNLEELGTLKQILLFLDCDKPEGPVADHIIKSRENYLKDDIDAAMDELIKAVMIDKSFCDELPRKTAIAFFRLLGAEHEVTRKYRRRFDMALY